MLHGRFGFGEYLDKKAIEMARAAASGQGDGSRYLSVVSLSLGGFVVDAGPFSRWFSPLRLRHVEFKYGCVDAGFALPSHMNHLVPITSPRTEAHNCRKAVVSTFDPTQLKKVDMKPTQDGHRKASSNLRPRMASMLKKTLLAPVRSSSLRVKQRRDERRISNPTSVNSPTSEAYQPRTKATSIRSWSNLTFR